MSKHPIILALLLVLVSCDVFYEDNKRLLFTGSVVDEDGLAIENLPVTAFTYGPSVFANGFREDLGEDFTDENGSFNLISLSPEGSYTIDMDMNGRYQVGYNSGFSSVSLLGLETLNLSDAAYRLSEIQLERIVNARVAIQRTTNTLDTLYLSIMTRSVEKTVYVDKSREPEIFEDFFFATDTVFPAENEKDITITNVLAKDTILVRYRLKNNSNAEIFTEKLGYTSQTGSYEFEF